LKSASGSDNYRVFWMAMVDVLSVDEVRLWWEEWREVVMRRVV